MEDVVKDLRALLVSVKGKVPLRQLERDYMAMMGCRIPYSEFGYESLPAFLNAQSGFSITNIHGEIFIDAAVSKKSAHISQMVGRQKVSKKKVAPKFISHKPSRFPNHQFPQKKFIPPASSYTYNAPPPRKNAPWHSVKTQRPTQENNPPWHSVKTPKPPQENISAKRPDISSRLQIRQEKPNQVEQPLERREPVRMRDYPVNTDEANKPEQPVNRISSSVRRPNIDTKSATSIEENNPNSSSCSSLLSTRKRLNAMMKNIKLANKEKKNQSASGNLNSPTYSPIMTNSPFIDIKMTPQIAAEPEVPEFLPATFSEAKPSFKEVEFSRTGNPVEDLKRFVEFHRLNEVKTHSVYIKGNIRGYVGKVSVGKYEFMTFPFGYKTEEEALAKCCEQALDKLLVEYSKDRALLVSDPKDILTRVPEMLKGHSKGLWDQQIEINYRETFKERLPEDWLKIVIASKNVHIEKASKGCILNHCTPEWRFQKAYHQNLNPQKLSPQGQDVSVPYCNVPQADKYGHLKAIVTCIVKADEIWCQQEKTDIYAEFEQMQIKMDDYYESNSAILKMPVVDKDCYYVIKHKNRWCRVRVVQANALNVTCFLVDYGDVVIMEKDQVYRLSSQFATITAQAFVCRLYGLEHLYSYTEQSKSLECLANQHVILELINDEGDENDPSWPVVIYNTEMDFSYNEQLETMLLIESAAPDLQLNKIRPVFVSNIENNGDIYVQIRTEGYDSLMKLLREVGEDVEQKPRTDLIKPITRENSAEKLFFHKFKCDGVWHRIQILDWAPIPGIVQIYYVDYGHTEIINLDEELLYPLEELNSTLALYPCQAVRIRMMMDSIPEDFKELAKKYIMNTESQNSEDDILLKVVDYINDKENYNLPLGEFFKRRDDGLFCINKSIACEIEIKKDSANNNSMLSKRNWINETKNVPSGGMLPCPVLPEKGGTLEVYVPFAVSPYNFFVQPFQSTAQLNQLMRRLQERYDSIQPSPLPLDAIKPGMIFASKNEADNCWFRTTVLKVIGETSISVFYCDFGYYTNLTVYNLVPLDPEFMKLPFQALKAKIPGVKPIKSKWTMEDCEEFKKMVEKKSFYCILMGKEQDELYPEDIVLSLTMIDTSSNNDVYINKELIRQGRAVEA